MLSISLLSFVISMIKLELSKSGVLPQISLFFEGPRLGQEECNLERFAMCFEKRLAAYSLQLLPDPYRDE